MNCADNKNTTLCQKLAFYTCSKKTPQSESTYQLILRTEFNCPLLQFHHRQHYDSITYYGQNKSLYLKLAIAWLHWYYSNKYHDLSWNCTQDGQSMLPQGSGRVCIKGKTKFPWKNSRAVLGLIENCEVTFREQELLLLPHTAACSWESCCPNRNLQELFFRSNFQLPLG